MHLPIQFLFLWRHIVAPKLARYRLPRQDLEIRVPKKDPVEIEDEAVE